MEYIAHTREDSDVQLLKSHLENVSCLAENFATQFRAGNFGAYAGMLHDIGKYSAYFQDYIRGKIQKKTDHSTAGAKEAVSDLGKNAIGFAVAYCISGHHAGLLNGGQKTDIGDVSKSLWARLNKDVEDYSSFKGEINVGEKPGRPPIQLITEKSGQRGNFSFSFFIRMIFSCLVDADFIDTEDYMTDGKANREKGDSIADLYEKLSSFLRINGYLQGKTGINKYRSDILKSCIERSVDIGPFFTLTVPTGGGKTISSMAFAMKNAVKYGRNRIIYVIPYCSIIEQTVDQFVRIFGQENVLAAYGNADYDSENLRLASENWDKPIVVTSSVQFFESFYSNRPSRCRKLHNVANSVLIFDEAQLLPEHLLRPCIRVIEELGINYNCVCVLCTATQPSFNKFFEKILVDRKQSTLQLREICQGTNKLYDIFKRVTYVDDGELTDEELVEKIRGYDQVLCVVSTRGQASSLAQMLHGDGVYHLSTLMTPAHRRETIGKIKQILAEGKTCRVVSTSLIEAGVDLDFPTVFKAIAGLDSIIQAGGRCNREGKRHKGDSQVHVFVPDEKYKVLSVMKRPREVEQMVTKGVSDIASPEIVKKYFDVIHNIVDSGIKSGLDREEIVDSFEDAQQCSYPFADVAEKFRVIDSDTYSVFIPIGSKGEEISYKLENDLLLSRDEYRYIGLHSVSIYENDLKKIRRSLSPIKDAEGRSWILQDMDLYDSDIGLRCEKEKEGEAIFA